MKSLSILQLALCAVSWFLLGLYVGRVLTKNHYYRKVYQILLSMKSDLKDAESSPQNPTESDTSGPESVIKHSPGKGDTYEATRMHEIGTV